MIRYGRKQHTGPEKKSKSTGDGLVETSQKCFMFLGQPKRSYLAGGFNPFQQIIYSQTGSIPEIGVNIEKIYEATT